MFIKCLSSSRVYQLFITHSHRHTRAQTPKKDFLHKPLGSILRSKAASLDQVRQVTCPAQDTTDLLWVLGNSREGQLRLSASCPPVAWGLFPWHLQARTASHNPFLHPGSSTMHWLREAGGMWTSLDNGISNWEATVRVNGMATRVKLRHLQFKPLGIMKNISIYNEVQKRFIKEIYNYNSLGKLFLLLNISSSFHSAWLICNYLLNQLFCSLNLDTLLGKGTSTLWLRSQIR